MTRVSRCAVKKANWSAHSPFPPARSASSTMPMAASSTVPTLIAIPNVWAHGDYGEITEHGGFVIHGRSDAVLNPGGVRIGTAEIYRQVERIDDVVESIVIGQEWQGDVRVVLFVVLRPGLILDDTLCAAIRQSIRDNTTPRHVPAKILQVEDIPRTHQWQNRGAGGAQRGARLAS